MEEGEGDDDTCNSEGGNDDCEGGNGKENYNSQPSTVSITSFALPSNKIAINLHKLVIQRVVNVAWCGWFLFKSIQWPIALLYHQLL